MDAVGLLDAAIRVAQTGQVEHRHNVAATGERVAGRIVDLTLIPLDAAVAMTFVDVTDERAWERRLVELSERDPLTGLATLPRFRSEVSDLIASGVPTVFALVELADLPLVNERLSHAAGNRLLQVMSERIRTQLPAEWRSARLGGEHFAVAAPGTPVEMDWLATRIDAVLSLPIVLDGMRIEPTVSLGLAHSPEDGVDQAQLLRMAEIALRRAKDQGVTHWCCDARDRGEAARMDRLRDSIGSAFESDQFVLYAQPFVELANYEIVGAEGLARWTLPETGVLGPGDFLDLLAVTGQSGQLTDLMVAKALELTEGGRTMSINLSPSDLLRPDLVSRVHAAFASTAGQAGTLWLEILESRVFEAGHQLIDDLITSGAHVAIDDFGAAFSSLTRLADHEISVLKLDRALLESLGSNPRARRVIRSVVEASHDLGALVVAEGVETMEACSVVEDLGCDLAQGFLLGRPAPEPLVGHLLRGSARLTPDDWPAIGAIREWEAQHVATPTDPAT
ncbi:MAG: bifunctional diguanylate cyclase/phosphodiesterase [Actinomycetota bacterium]